MRPRTLTSPRAPGPSTGPPRSRSPPAPRPASVSKDRDPEFRLLLPGLGPRLRCRIDGAAFASCAVAAHDLDALRRLSHLPGRGNRRGPEPSTSPGASSSVDATPPAVTIKGRRRVMTERRKTSAGFTLRASEEVGRRCRIDSRRFEPCSWRYRTPKLGRGAHTLEVKATDRVGNVGTKRKRFKIVRK